MKWLTHNFGYKLLSLVLAVWLWAYVQTQHNPPSEKQVVVSLRVPQRGDLLVLDAPETVRVKLKGFRDDLRGFDSNRLRAELDLSHLELSDDNLGRKRAVPVRVTSPLDPKVQVVGPEPRTVHVTIDKMVSVLRDVELKKPAKLPAGYRLDPDPPTFNPDKVMLRGARSQVQKVNKVWVEIVVADPQTPLPKSLPVKPVDKMGVAVTGLQITPSQIEVSAQLRELPIVRNLSIKAQVVGQPAPGYHISGVITVVPTAVAVSAEPTLLKDLTVISTEPIDISGVTQTVVRRAHLELPEGVTTDATRVRVEIPIAREAPPPPPPTERPPSPTGGQ